MEHLHIILQMFYSIFHQGDYPGFLPFPMKRHSRRPVNFNVADFHIQNFLDTRPGIIQKDHQELIVKAYRTTLNQFLKYTAEQKNISVLSVTSGMVTYEMVNSYLDWLSAEKNAALPGYAPRYHTERSSGTDPALRSPSWCPALQEAFLLLLPTYNPLSQTGHFFGFR